MELKLPENDQNLKSHILIPSDNLIDSSNKIQTLHEKLNPPMVTKLEVSPSVRQLDEKDPPKAVLCRSTQIMKKQFKAVQEGIKITKYLHQQRDILIHDLDTLEGDSLVEEVISLLKKQWKNRTYRDNRVITKCVSNLAFFKSHFGKNHEQMILKCAQYFKYQFCRHGEKVFEQGESGDLFFVILKGRVSIHVDFKRQEVNEENNITEDVFMERRVLIVGFKKGESFGELALIDKKPRSATITCIGDCHFITFDKVSFDKILKNQQIKMFKEELQKLKKNYLFSTFSGNSLKTLYLLFQIVPFHKGDTIIKEGDPSDQIFLIREGEFKVQRTAYIKIEGDASSQLNINQKKKESIIIDLGILGQGQSFGEEEFFSKENRKVNVICLSRQGELMILNRREFFKKMGYDVEQIKKMEEKALVKNNFREKQFEKQISTYVQTRQQQVGENKNGLFLDQQLSQIEQDQLHQKELIEQSLHADNKQRPVQKQPFHKRSSLITQETKHSQVSNSIIKYHFIRKKVITSHTGSNDNEDLEAIHTSFQENTGLHTGTYHLSSNGNIGQDFQKYKMETISSPLKLSQKMDSSSLKPLEASLLNRSTTSKQDMDLNESMQSPDKQISTYLKRLSVMSSVSVDLRRNSQKPLIELQSPIPQRSQKNGMQRLSQFNDLNISNITIDSMNEDKKIQLEDSKLNINTPKNSQNMEFKQAFSIKESTEKELPSTKNQKRQEDDSVKMLITQELQHHSFFLNKRKHKVIENQFFKNLDEKLLSNKSIQKFFGLKQKPIVQIKELFTQKEKQLMESKKYHKMSEQNTPKNQKAQEEDEEASLFDSPNPHFRYSMHYTLKNYSSMGTTEDFTKTFMGNSTTVASNQLLSNSQFNRKNSTKKLLSSIVVPYSERIKQLISLPSQDHQAFQLGKLENKKRGFSMQLKNDPYFEVNNNNNNKLNTQTTQFIQKKFESDLSDKKPDLEICSKKLEYGLPCKFETPAKLDLQNIQNSSSSKVSSHQTFAQAKKTDVLHYTQTNMSLPRENNKPQQFYSTVNGNFFVSSPKTPIIAVKDNILNDGAQRLPLKYISSKLRDFSDEQKGRFLKSQSQSHSISSLKQFSKKIIDLSVQGYHQSKLQNSKV